MYSVYIYRSNTLAIHKSKKMISYSLISFYGTNMTFYIFCEHLLINWIFLLFLDIKDNVTIK